MSSRASRRAPRPRRDRCTAPSACRRRHPASRPGESGRPSVATPEPACTSRRSRVAVVAADELDDFARPVTPARAAARSSSPRCPELTKRTSSTAGIAAHEPASSSSSGVGAPKLVPAPQRLLEGRDDRGVRVAEDQRPPGERRSRCSGCRRRRQVGALAALDERRLPPTARKARTGELTPPGARDVASAKSRSDVSLIHTPVPASARATDSAAASPEAMQSGIPTPRYAAPARASPGWDESACSIRSSRPGGRGRTAASRGASAEPERASARPSHRAAELVSRERDERSLVSGVTSRPPKRPA